MPSLYMRRFKDVVFAFVTITMVLKEMTQLTSRVIASVERVSVTESFARCLSPCPEYSIKCVYTLGFTFLLSVLL